MIDPIDALGAALADRYTLDREVGRGGMALVFLAQDQKHDRQVAIKVLRPELSHSIGRDRFLREIKLAASLNHPRILPLHDSGVADDFLYFVMPYVEGPSLRSRLEREGRLDTEEALRITSDIASALDHANQRGVVHRDIKPENIMMHHGVAMVTDFGISKAINAATDDNLTHDRYVLGTPSYMSPEQAMGEPTDGRSDIYSLACMLFEMLVGERLFDGPSSRAILMKRFQGSGFDLERALDPVPGDLRAGLRAALHKNPDRRFTSGVEFVTALSDPQLPTLSVPTPAGLDVPVMAVPAESIAVLPFRNISADPENEYFSDGLAEEIITDLSSLRSLRVISRTSVMQLKGTDKDIKTIGRTLDVRYVLQGSVRKAGDNLRIAAQLIDATTDSHLWAEKFTGTVEDVFDIQEKVSRAIVKALELELTAEENREIARRPIPDIRAYQSYLRARHDIWSFTEDAVQRALEHLESAQGIVGDNVLLHAAMAEAHYVRPHISGHGTRESLEKIDACVSKIFALEPGSPHGLLFSGITCLKRPGGVQEAVRRFKEASNKSPNDAAIRLYLGYWAVQTGQFAAAREHLDALVALDPLAPMSHWSLGWLRLLQSHFDRALQHFEKAHGMDDTSPQIRFHCGLARVLDGRRASGLALWDSITTETPENVWAWMSTFFGHVVSEDRDAALASVTEELATTALWDEMYCWHLAEGHAALGAVDPALLWLERAIERGFTNHPLLSSAYPPLGELRSEPRFSALLEKCEEAWRRLEI